MKPRAESIHVGPETEIGRGWSYEVLLDRPGIGATRHTVTLSWSDHDLIAGGRYPPSRTVEAAMGVALSAGEPEIERLPERFDISTLRRMINQFDAQVRERL